ncbi:hypothetical protein [Burkholderia pseudomallei]|uniref:hypothetical protein n=1 Tax=Burkholderia pseudomallei TaxID=28450 RepID=UPI001178AB2A|nr:hypothetical protein [Burkholderia pseudomallei]
MTRQDISENRRIAFRDEHMGWTIEVATGYDVTTNRWPVHVYVTRPGGQREKIAVHDHIRDSKDEAIEHGFAAGTWHVNHEAE